MPEIDKSGTFRDRERFLTGLKAKTAELREGPLRGVEETWSEEAGVATGVLSGFGVEVRFTVEAEAWNCRAQTPVWLPVPISKIEAKLDEVMGELSEG